MAAASYVSKQLEAKVVAAELLTDFRLTEVLHTLIRAAAGSMYGRTTQMDQVCAYPDGDLSKKREGREPCSNSSRYIVEYHPDDLTIVGGMALSLYDHAITDVKIARSLKPLQEYLTKNTSDIDMVWWPRIIDREPFLPKEIITINSPAIIEQIERFRKNMEIIFHNMQYVQTIMQLIPNAASLNIHVVQETTLGAGVVHIKLYFQIMYQNGTTIQLEICDISIHDGGCSQKIKGPQGLILKPMMDDPMYVSPINQINSLKMKKIQVSVPTIEKLVEQQLLLFSGLLMKKDNKAMIAYHRLRYIQFVLAPRNAHKQKVLKLFGTSEQGVKQLIVKVDKEINRIIAENCKGDNRELCMKLIEYEEVSKAEYLQEHRELAHELELRMKEQHDAQMKALQIQHYLQQQQLMQQQTQFIQQPFYPPFLPSYPQQSIKARVSIPHTSKISHTHIPSPTLQLSRSKQHSKRHSPTKGRSPTKGSTPAKGPSPTKGPSPKKSPSHGGNNRKRNVTLKRR